MAWLQKNKKKIVILFFWLLVWQGLTFLVGNTILMAGPVETLQALWQRMGEGKFYLTILYSLVRIFAGFFLAFLAGTLLAWLAARTKWVEQLIAPVMSLLKSVPVASFVVLLLIWWGSKWLSVGVVFLTALPIVYQHIYQGLCSVDQKLLEMAGVFSMSAWNRFFYIERTNLAPFLENCLRITLGMSWKAGVAAEVIGTPMFSIGGELYLSKVYLDTPGVFAYTAVIIVLSFLFEKAGLWLFQRFCHWKPGCTISPRNFVQDSNYQVEKFSYSYKDNVTAKKEMVLQNISQNLEAGKVYCLMAPSGAGKTTLLHLMAGLRLRGTFVGQLPKAVCGVGFQDYRLAEEETPVKNLEMVLGKKKRQEAIDALQELLPKEALAQKVSQLSGGMKARVSLARALLYPAAMVLLDEPFAGLDQENIQNAATFLRKYQQGRTIVIATHRQEERELLQGELWKL